VDDVITLSPNPDVETATNIPLSFDQQTDHQLLLLVVPVVQLIPSGDVITLLFVPVCETATNKLNSADQHTENQSLSAALDLNVQLIPSGDVITLLSVPDRDTATNKPNSAATPLIVGRRNS
jgi:hypothetical protein